MSTRELVQYDGSIPGLVYLPFLSSGKWNQWAKVREAENALTYLINHITNLPRMVDNGKEGYFPYYDAYWLDEEETKIEIKMSMKDKVYPLELSKGDGAPSGLSITHAKYYLTVNRGWLNHTPDGPTADWEAVGKIHLVETEILKEYVQTCEPLHARYLRPHSNQSESSWCMNLDFKLLYDKDGDRADGWICDIPLLYEGNEPVGYDFRLSKVIRMSPRFKK
ncbi:MAG: hypothetical protein EO766_12155 [Hydrotalea sp. AMD]|uniref:hypothetical protein n=1 Tax=Hydrotalea sp. AMD TaxID=2501297 RepID=UPI0010275300|nr:hypothetical protein [Hydrotalea sp. AMD]RWZ87270.1 MAG: hypothetical protein EO766_12155 [Hydrotalea sp. AMD]